MENAREFGDKACACRKSAIKAGENGTNKAVLG